MVELNYSKAMKGYEDRRDRDGGDYAGGSRYDRLDFGSGEYGGASTIEKESSNGSYKTGRFKGNYRLPESSLGNLLAGIPTAK